MSNRDVTLMGHFSAPTRAESLGGWTLRQSRTFFATVWPARHEKAVQPAAKAATNAPPRSWLHRNGWRLGRRAVLGTAIAILVLAIGLALFRAHYSNEIYPGVAVGGVDVGGHDRAGAAALVQQRADQLEQGTVRFTYHGKTWTPTLQQLGISFDINRSLDAAFAYGRESVAWDRMSDTFGLLRHEENIPLAVTWNQTTLGKWFDQVDHDLGQPPHDAYISINGTKVTIVPEVDGTVVDRPAATEQINGALVKLAPLSASLPVLPKIAAVRANDLTALQQQAAQALSQPITLTYHGKSWTLQPADLGKFLKTKRDPAKTGAAAVSLTVDQQGLAAWLNDKLASSINSDPVNAKIAWSDDDQAIFATEDSKDGARLAPLTLAADVGQSLLGNHTAIPIPTTDIKPQIDSNNLAALGITTKIAVGDSSYEGSDDARATNINVAVGLLNGTLVPPHGTFSFNHAIGVIEPSKGYVVGQIIDGNHISTDDGGGVCQVSTTVYRAAFEGGLPIAEVWPHHYRLGFYELDGWQPGIDSSILQPDGDPFSGGDLKFENPTDHWILVEAYTENERAYVILYGAELGYKVTVSDSVQTGTEPADPPTVQVDNSLPPGTIEKERDASKGSDWVVTRTVKDRNGNLIEQRDFESDYAGEGALYVVSPDMKNKVPTS